MYTTNLQIKISLLNYSHSSINLSFDVLHGLFTQCSIYLICWLPDPVRLCYFFKKKFIFWNVVFLVKVIKFLWRGFLFSDRLRIVRESAWQNSMQCILLKPGKVYGKSRSLNGHLISNSVIQIHSFCLVRYYAALAVIVLVLMVGEADGQDFFLTKTIGSDFLLFNYMLLSA